MPKFKKQPSPSRPVAPAPQAPQAPGQQVQNLGVPFAPIGLPVGIPNVPVVQHQKPQQQQPPPLAMPGSNLKRAVNYYADYGGCGFWRMVWPETLLNGYQKAIINGLTTMVLDPRFYQGVDAVRLQRQATPVQLNFVKFLKQGSEQHDFKIIYEIDDVVFKDDIPMFNRCRDAFDDPQIVSSILEMMGMSDELSVTCDYMKEYYKEKSGNKKVSVIPNYAPRFWMDGFYDKKIIAKNWEDNKGRPRVGYCGSGTHIDVLNRTGQQDDFSGVVKQIIKTRKDFKWVMMGAYPLHLKPLVDSGEIEYIPWSMIYDFPKAIHDLNLQAVIAPLQDNTFNRAKSNIKYLESACLGIPGTFQNLCTYKDAPVKFDAGDEMIDQLNMFKKDQGYHMKISKESRAYAETMWLEDHLDEYHELYFTKWGSDERKALLKNNQDQKGSNNE
jgi:hypothetical protein